jgi:hypothetical protein
MGGSPGLIRDWEVVKVTAAATTPDHASVVVPAQ